MTRETAVKNSTPPPFPQALKAKKKTINQVEILEVLRQVKVNIPPASYDQTSPHICQIFEGLVYSEKRVEC